MSTECYSRVNEMFNKVSAGETSEKCYNDWATQYDDDTVTIKKNDYMAAIQAVERHYKDNRDALILDIGAGTGYAAEELTKLGFRNLEAVDPSAEMLKLASEKNLYKQLYQHLLGPSPLAVADDTYDCAIALGVIAPQHLQADSLPEIYRVLKKGGLFMIQGNYPTWCKLPEYHVTMKGALDDMVAAGKLDQVEWNILKEYTNYGHGVMEGLLFIYRKLQ